MAQKSSKFAAGFHGRSFGKNHSSKSGMKKNEKSAVFEARPVFLYPLLVILFLAFTFLSPVEGSIDIRSRAAVVMDASTGRILYAKNPDLKLLPASTTKLMTALVVLEKANLSDVVTVSKRAAGAPPIRMGLREGDRVTIENLLYAALMKSANDAAVALAEAVAGSEEEFVKLMNRKAVAIGAADTKYINPNGLPGEGQYITAYDLSKIMRQAIRYPVLKEILGTRITEVSTQAGKQKIIRNTNKLLWSDEELLGGKTGFTRQARHCFVCAGERDNETIIVALLGAPRRDLLWKETEDLLAFGSSVMNKSEEPVLYLTKTDQPVNLAKLAYHTGDSPEAEHAKINKRNMKHKKILKTAKAAGKSRKTVAKKRAVKYARHKKGKASEVALRKENEAKG